MPKTPINPDRPRLASTIVLSPPDRKHPAWAAWQAHVEAGRIGSGRGGSMAQLRRHAHNERVVLGEVVMPDLRAPR